MRKLLRLVLLLGITGVLVAGVVVTIPTVVRDIYRHGSTTVAAVLPPLTSTFADGSTVYAADGTTVLAVLRASKTQLPVQLSAVAPILIHAVLDTEDERFYQHGGIDLPSTIRALLSDSAGNSLQGGSTITQQLVKQVYLTPQRKLSRKIREAVIADRLEKLYTKNQILDAYLNTIYLGSGAYGVEAAAEAYWSEKASQVTIPQAALLAGLIQAPSGYDPVTNPAAARARRTEVLGRMLHYHTIDRAQYDSANATALPTTGAITPAPLSGPYGYYVAQVESQLLGPGSPLGATRDERSQVLFEGGLSIYTNLDLPAEAEAQRAVAAETPYNTGGYVENLVSIDPSSGNVTTLVAGPDYATNQFDVVTEGHRQPGSGFKIFTLLAALQAGDNVLDPVDGKSPCAIPFPGNDGYLLKPATNDEGDAGAGETNILGATADSLNCAYLRIAHQIGIPAVIAMAEKLGLPRSEIGGYAETPSMVLGAIPVEPLQMAAAYATLAAGGVYHAPQFLNRVVDRTGTTIYQESTKGTTVLSPTVVAEADVAFQAVVEGGTGTAARIYGREVAGKTGTTSGPTDAWFNGYTPQLETTVWMGNPTTNSQLVIDGVGVYGGTYPARTVQAFMAADLVGQPVETFPLVDYADLPRIAAVPEASAYNPYSTTIPTYRYSSPPTGSTVPGSPPTAPTAPTSPVVTSPAGTSATTSPAKSRRHR